MRRTILGVPVVVALAACMHMAPREAAPLADALDVTLLPALAANTVVPSLTFALNRPAYVAAFEVIPGRGVRLLYPYAPEMTRNPGGMNLVTETPAFYDDYLRSALGVPSAGPRYTYVVASDTPLRLGTFTQPAGLLAYFGDAQFASYRASTLIDGVIAAVIPADASDDSWASDMVVDWSNAPLAAFALASTRIACDNGSVLTVPAGFGSTVCPADAVRTARASVVANTDALHTPSRRRGRAIVTALTHTPVKSARQEPRRRPWWYANPGFAWIGDMSPEQMAPIFVRGEARMHSASVPTTAARSSTPVRQAAASRSVTHQSTPAHREIKQDVTRTPR